jgi:hypothetical protein
MQKAGIGMGSMSLNSGQNIMHDKGISFRYYSGNKWMHELSGNNYSVKNEEDKAEIKTKYETNAFELAYAIHHDVTYPGIGYMFPWLRKMKTYIGVSITTGIYTEKINVTNSAKDIRHQNYSCLLGFHYSRIFPITPTLSISSQILYITDIFQKYNSLSAASINIDKRLGVNTAILIKL